MIERSHIHPRSLDDLSSSAKKTIEAIPGQGLKGKLAPVNVLGTLMHSEKLIDEFLAYWVKSKNEMSLSVREQELIILRMGYHYNCDYVWRHHVPVAQEFSVSQQELDALQSRFLSDRVFSVREKSLISLCDEMILKRTISELSWRYGTRELEVIDILDLIHLISQYVLFSLANNVFRIPVEEALGAIPGLAGR